MTVGQMLNDIDIMSLYQNGMLSSKVIIYRDIYNGFVALKEKDKTIKNVEAYNVLSRVYKLAPRTIRKAVESLSKEAVGIK